MKEIKNTFEMFLARKVALLNALCDLYELPADIKTYLGTRFYGPFHHAAREKRLIDRLARTLHNPHLLLEVIIHSENHTDMLRRLVRNPLFTLDTRINDGRITKYVTCFEKMRECGIYLPEIAYILFKGLEIDDHNAFRILHQSNIRSSTHPAVLDYLARRSNELTALRTWDMSVRNRMEPLVLYCIDNEIDELLLEWISIWPIKGWNVVQNIINNSHYRHENKVSKMYERLRSPLLAERRQQHIMNAINIEKQSI